MTSLLDIGPLTEEVPVGKKKVTVRGVTPEGFFYLLAKYPALQSMFGGNNSTIEAMITIAPESAAHAIALATTDRSAYPTLAKWQTAVEKSAKVAVNLPAHYQMALFQAAINLTFPDGIGPFMKGVEALANSINRVSGSKVPVTTSSKPSRSGFVTDSRGLRLGQGAPSRSSQH